MKVWQLIVSENPFQILEIVEATKTNQASHDSNMTQILMFQLFQSQIQSQDSKIDKYDGELDQEANTNDW